jgi:hypothetical protein
VRLPQARQDWPVGTSRIVTGMPSGLDCIATLKGTLASTGLLPASGNHLGDAWSVNNHLWVWLVAPGTGHAAWIDP